MTSAIIEAVAGAQLDLDNPWPGLEAYHESSHAFFSGRDAEVDELYRRIVDEPITVLFGRSGLGKTSLLKAGVFPRLRDKDLLPVFFRPQIRPGAEPPLEQARLALFRELRAQGVEHPDPREGETLWNYLHRRGLEFWTRQNRLVRPVLVFDQFEEVFTLGRTIPAVIAAFREDLSDLVENRIPATIARQLDDRSIADLGLDPHVMPYKVVLSLREDFLADLEEWRVTMPSLRRNRMRLLPMGCRAAMQAVYNDRTRHLVAEPLARTIVHFLSSAPAVAEGDSSPGHASATIEPALLSLFCRGANEHRKLNGDARFDDVLIEGAKDTIVADFYRSSLADQPERVQKFIEEQLITESGFRNSYSVDDAVAMGSLTRGELDTLVNRHLLRHEHHLGADRIELTHDLLTAAVAGGRDERRLAEREARGRQERRRLRRVRNRFAAAALVFLGLAISAWSARRSANVERDQSRSRELAAFANGVINEDAELAVVLAREGLEQADTAEARSAFLDAAQYVWPHALLGAKALHGNPTALALSPDGSRLAVLAEGGTLTVWNVSAGQPSIAWTKKALDGASSLAFSPDQRLIAVGRHTSIDLFQAESGRLDVDLTALVNSHLGNAVDDRRISFSPDGVWLASTQSDDVLRLLDYRNGLPAPPVPVKSVAQFAVAAGGKRIVTVSSGLAAHVIELRGRTWTPIEQDLSRCMVLQSVSPGPVYSSATWKAGSCTFSTTTLSHESRLGTSAVTDDIVWSPGGLAHAEILRSEDVIVGRRDGLRFRVKGGHPLAADDKSRFVSVSETGKRLALIDEDEQVKVYFLADDKPFLSPFGKDARVVSADGGWIAALSDPSQDEPAAIDVVALDGLQSSALPRRMHIVLDAVPTRIAAARNAVIAEFDAPRDSSLVLDVETGRPRFARLQGRAEPLGEHQELLLVRSGEASQVVRTRDGASVTPWAPGPAGAGTEPPAVLVSPGRRAIAVLTEGIPTTAGRGRMHARIYVVRGDMLDSVGHVQGLPMKYSLNDAASDLALSENGATIVDGSGRRWVTVAQPSKDDPPEPPVQKELAELELSPQNTFEIEAEPASAHGKATGSKTEAGYVLRRRIDRTVIKKFPNDGAQRRFSSDDRWLAVWRPARLEVFDLASGKTLLTSSYRRAIRVADVTFTAGNTMLSVELEQDRKAAGSILVPLDYKTMLAFADWLTPRTLTAKESCLFGFDAAACVEDVGAPGRPGHDDRR